MGARLCQPCYIQSRIIPDEAAIAAMRPMTIWERSKAHREAQELARRATQTIAEGLSYCTISIASILVVELSGVVRNLVVERSGSYSPSLS